MRSSGYVDRRCRAQCSIKCDKPFKLYDSGGLFLMVNTAGGIVWRLRFAIGGKEKLLGLGPYTEVTLDAAS